MAKLNERKRLWERRKQKTRRQLRWSSRPLLTCYRSGRHIYAQIVDPETGRTLTSVSSRSPAVRENLRSGKGIEAASKVGAAIARLALGQNIETVAFNRNGFVYAGRVRALADAAREAGLKF